MHKNRRSRFFFSMSHVEVSVLRALMNGGDAESILSKDELGKRILPILKSYGVTSVSRTYFYDCLHRLEEQKLVQVNWEVRGLAVSPNPSTWAHLCAFLPPLILVLEQSQRKKGGSDV